MSNNVKTIEIEATKEITQQAAIQDAMQKSVSKVTSDVTKAVLSVVLDQLETRSNEILETVTKLAKPREVAIAIKINEGELKKLKVAAHPMLADTINLLALGLSPLLVGPAGCGKTFLGEQSAEALGINYGHLCFSAGVSETWLFGRQTPTGFVEGEFSKLYKNGGLFLGDELDAADPNLLLTINTALANGHMYNPISGENIKRHKDFHFVGTANTFGKGGNSIYTGRSRLDAATLDRFTTLEIDYLEVIEEALCPDNDMREYLQGVRNNVKDKGSTEVVSYRAFDKAYKLKKSGVSMAQIKQMLFASWPTSTRSACV